MIVKEIKTKRKEEKKNEKAEPQSTNSATIFSTNFCQKTWSKFNTYLLRILLLNLFKDKTA